MWDEYAKSIGTTADNLTQQQKIQAEVTGILEESKYQVGDAAKVADSYSGQILKLGFNFNNLKVAIGNALIPLVQAVLPSINAIIIELTRLVNVFAQFLTSGLPMITAFATQAVEAFTVLFEEVKTIFDMLWSEGIKPALDIVMRIWTDTVNCMAEAWNEYGVPIFEEIQEVFINVGEALGTVWETILKPVWDTFMQTIDWLWSNHLKPFLDNFLALVGEFIVAALRITNEFILPLVKSFVEIFGPAIANEFQTVVSILGTFLAAAADIISGVVTVIRGIIEFLTGVFTDDWKKALNGIVTIFKGIFEGIGGIVKGVVNTVIDMINGMIRAATDGLNDVISTMNQLSWTVPDWVPGLGGKIFGFNIKPLIPYTIPKLATGAVIPPNSEFLTVLGDQSSGRNLEAPEDLIRQIVREETDSNEMLTVLRDIYSVIREGKILLVDKHVLGKVVNKSQSDSFKRAGTTIIPV